MNEDKKEYKRLDLPDGGYIQIKFEYEGIVYDRFNVNDELQEEYGYDFYYEVLPQIELS